MSRTYDYKRIGTRKLSLRLSIVITLMFAFVLATSSAISTTMILLFIAVLCLCAALIYSAYKKHIVATDTNEINLWNKIIPIEKIRSIKIGDKRIEMQIDKGIFIGGTNLYFTDACFYSLQDWNDFKQDLEVLKNKLA